MRPRTSRVLDEITEELKKQLGSTAMDLGALRSTVDNQLVNSKIAGSYSGHFLDASIRAIAAKLILFICRTCENNGSSLAKALELLSELGPEIEKRRLEDHPEWPKDYLEIGNVANTVCAAKTTLDSIVTSGEYARARLLRDERYAHLLRGKSDLRRRQRDKFEEFDDITFKEVETLAYRVLLLCEEVIRIWTFEVVDVDSKISIAERYSTDFWKALPVLSEAERSQ